MGKTGGINKAKKATDELENILFAADRSSSTVRVSFAASRRMAPEEPNVYSNKRKMNGAPEERHQRSKSDAAPPELITVLLVTINIRLLRSQRNSQTHFPA